MGNSPPNPLRSVVHICKKVGMRAETMEQNEDTRTGLSPEPGTPWPSTCSFWGPTQTYKSESQGGLLGQYLKMLGGSSAPFWEPLHKLLVHKDWISLLPFWAPLKIFYLKRTEKQKVKIPQNTITSQNKCFCVLHIMYMYIFVYMSFMCVYMIDVYICIYIIYIRITCAHVCMYVYTCTCDIHVCYRCVDMYVYMWSVFILCIYVCMVYDICIHATYILCVCTYAHIYYLCTCMCMHMWYICMSHVCWMCACVCCVCACVGVICVCCVYGAYTCVYMYVCVCILVCVYIICVYIYIYTLNI